MKKAILAVSMFLFVVAANAQQDSKMATPAASPAPAVQDNKNAPDFKFDVEEFNFGTIKQGEKVSYDFNFANVGKEPLIITEAHGSCGCTVPTTPKEPIAPGLHLKGNVEAPAPVKTDVPAGTEVK